MRRLIAVCLVVLFATNAYADIVVYEPGSGAAPGDTSAAMDIILGAGNWTLRNALNPVTAADLAGAELLVVGWNEWGDMSGLSAAVLESGITGNILLTGHDADYHTRYPSAGEQAQKFLTQAMDFGMDMGGTGLVALADWRPSSPGSSFDYLPASWGVTATTISGSTITSFTAEGLASGVYDDITLAGMSGWGVSFHDMITTGFTPFEIGSYGGGDVTVTVGHVVPVPGAVLLAMLGLSVAGVKLRRKA